MSVRVEVCPILRRKCRLEYAPDEGLILSDVNGKPLHQIAQELGIALDEVTSTLVNHRAVPPNHRVRDGDSVYFAIAISGG